MSRKSLKPKTSSRNSRKKISPADPTDDYTRDTLRYAREVVAGTITASSWVKLGCQRHLHDLERSNFDGFPYRYDADCARRACSFIEALPHVKGRWAKRGERLQLQNWQRFIVCSIFGWIHKRTGRRRFRMAYICVPRKNGKSPLAAAIGLYMLCADGEHGAEVYSGATSEKQAWEVFRPARQMVLATPELQKAFGIEVNAKSLVILRNGSRFEPVIGKPGDGAAPSCGIVDEYHEHTDDTLFETFKTGMVGRESPLLLIITTAGSDRSGPCYNWQLDVEKILQGQIKDETLFGLIYTIDNEADWQDSALIQVANPNFGVSVDAEQLLADHKGAIQSAHRQNAFKTKHLNIWCNAAVGWMNMAAWDACKDESMKIEDFVGEECWLSLDLASKLDLIAKYKIFRRNHVSGGKPHYYGFGDYYQNRSQVDQNTNYQQWENEGLLTVTEGNVTDFNFVANAIEADCSRFRVREIPHDPYNATPLLQFLQSRPNWNQSVLPVEITQSKLNYTPAMRELEAAVAEKRFHHNGDKVLAWAISNVVIKPDSRDYIYPLKQKPEDKIDPACAALMGILRAQVSPSPSVYESRGLLSI